MDYTQYLKIKARVPEKYIPFYNQWVVAWKTHIAAQPNAENLLQTFTRSLNTRFQPWQVQQAFKAVQHYMHYQDINKRNQSIEQDHQTPTDSMIKRESLDQELISETRCVLQLQHKSISTRKVYLNWIQRFLVHTQNTKPDDLDSSQVREFLTSLVIDSGVAAATQNQAFNAILYFYKNTLKKEISGLENTIRSKRPKRLPFVLTRMEIQKIFSTIQYPYILMVSIIYGGGLRLQECLSLRIKDIDIERNCISIIAGKGNKDRLTLFPASLAPLLLQHLKNIRTIYDQDRAENRLGVWLPNSLLRKYPSASTSWNWFWLFPAKKESIEPDSDTIRRFHIYPTTLQRIFKKAVDQSGVTKKASVHTLRHSFATHLLENGYDIRTIQEIMGHADVQTTMIYTHVANKNKLGVISPFQELNSPANPTILTY